ncbi:hypothetical protein K1719_011944 [Acacia pycnantha]|nr:hypothetical protein K1719_011944 [Acacia pycnantha]
MRKGSNKQQQTVAWRKKVGEKDQERDGGTSTTEQVECSKLSTLHKSENDHRVEKSDKSKIMVCHCKPPLKGQLGCQNECPNRLLNIECVQGAYPCGDLCSNQQVLDMHAYEAPQSEYALNGRRHFYILTLNSSEVIGASAKGNLGRFINHSCDPNCFTKKDARKQKFMIGNFHKSEITDDKDIKLQTNKNHKLNVELQAEKIDLPYEFVVGVLIEKMPNLWNDYKQQLKHKQKKLSLNDLITHIIIEGINRKAIQAAKGKEMATKANLVKEKTQQEKHHTHTMA